MNSLKALLVGCVITTSFSHFTSVSAEFNFEYGMEIGMGYRNRPAQEYAPRIQSILKANLDADDGEIEDNPENAINTPYEKYMCGIETRLIRNQSNEYVYLHESTGAGRRFEELVGLITPGLEVTSSLVRRLNQAWSEADKHKFKAFPHRSSLYISSEHIAALFRNMYKIYRGILPYKTGDRFPAYVGHMEFDSNWNIVCDKYFKLTGQGLTTVDPGAVISNQLKDQLTDNTAIVLGANGEPTRVSLQDCVKLAQRKFLSGNFVLENVLLGNVTLPGYTQTEYDRWLASFQDTLPVGEEKTYSAAEIEQKAAELAMQMTTSDGKMRQNLLSIINLSIQSEDSSAIERNGKKYHRALTIDLIVKSFRKIYESRKMLEDQFCNTLFEDFPIKQTGEIEGMDGFFQLGGNKLVPVSGESLLSSPNALYYDVLMQAVPPLMNELTKQGFSVGSYQYRTPQRGGALFTATNPTVIVNNLKAEQEKVKNQPLALK